LVDSGNKDCQVAALDHDHRVIRIFLLLCDHDQGVLIHPDHDRLLQDGGLHPIDPPWLHH